MTLDWRRALVDRYPHLFLHGSKKKQFAPGYPTVGDGWRELVERAIERIEAVASGRVRINQIKQKFGTLRLHFDTLQGLTNEQKAAVEDAVALAEARSECASDAVRKDVFIATVGCFLLRVLLMREASRFPFVPVSSICA